MKGQQETPAMQKVGEILTSSAASCSRAELRVHQIAHEPQRIGVGGWSNCSQVPVQFSHLRRLQHTAIALTPSRKTCCKACFSHSFRLS